MKTKIRKSTIILVVIIVLQVMLFSFKTYCDFQNIKALEYTITHLETRNNTLIEKENKLQSQIDKLELEIKNCNAELSLYYSPEKLLSNVKEAYSSLELGNSPRIQLARIHSYTLKLHKLFPNSELTVEAQSIEDKANNVYAEYLKKTSTQPTTTSISSNSNSKKEKIVYITNTGTKYHKSSCSYLKQSKISISLSKAIKRGYTPCSRCNP